MITVPFSVKLIANTPSTASPLYASEKRPGAVIVVGEIGVGKTAFCAALAEACTWTVGETGMVIARDMAQHKAVVDPYYDKKEWFEKITQPSTKNYHRRELVSFGNLMTAIRPDYLIDECCAAGHRIIAGVRRHREVEARLSSGFHDIYVKIERPGWTAPRDSFELHEIATFLKGIADVRVIENRGVKELGFAAAMLANELRAL